MQPVPSLASAVSHDSGPSSSVFFLIYSSVPVFLSSLWFQTEKTLKIKFNTVLSSNHCQDIQAQDVPCHQSSEDSHHGQKTQATMQISSHETVYSYIVMFPSALDSITKRCTHQWPSILIVLASIHCWTHHPCTLLWEFSNFESNTAEVLYIANPSHVSYVWAHTAKTLHSIFIPFPEISLYAYGVWVLPCRCAGQHLAMTSVLRKRTKNKSAPFTPQEPLARTRVKDCTKGSSWIHISFLLLKCTDTTAT